jgi:DNA-binding PadR family transcriptional regulator
MTNAELAILGLIAEKPRHGYEIEQVIEERGMRDWTEIGFSSIYYLLKKLEAARLIEGNMERQAGQGPARNVYQITPAGYEARRDGVLEALSSPQRRTSALQLGLANLPGIQNSAALSALRNYHDKLIAQLGHVRSRWKEQSPLPYFVEAMFEHSVALISAELEWLERFISQLEDQSDQDRFQEGPETPLPTSEG